MESGLFLYLCLSILGLLFVFLARTCWALLKKMRDADGQSVRAWLTFIGMGFSALATGSLFLLHLTWVSAEVSQYLGVRTVTILSTLFFLPAGVSLVLCFAGSGKTRFLGIGACLLTGLWWVVLVTDSAITMGAVTARHPVRYLIPDNYIGWVEIRYGQPNAGALPIKDGALICRFPESGLLDTSSGLETGSAKDEYFYYSGDEALRPLKSTGWGQGGVIWGETNSTDEQFFFVGTEQQFRSGATTGRHGPFE